MTIFDKYTIDLIQIIRPIVYIGIGIIIYEISKAILQSNSKKRLLKKKHHQKRVKTVSLLILNIIKYLIILFIIILTLSNFGINVGSILAGVGIIAAIVGLAFQDLAKDLIAGISIILEDQYEIGDTVEINGFTGEVVGLGLKSTRIKNYKGQTLIVANHIINQVINYNLYNNLAVVDISIGYEHKSEDVEKILNQMAESLKGKIPKAKGDIKVLGITSLEANKIIYRITLETSPTKHFSVERVLIKEIKNYFDKKNIKISDQQFEVHNGNK